MFQKNRRNCWPHNSYDFSRITHYDMYLRTNSKPIEREIRRRKWYSVSEIREVIRGWTVLEIKLKDTHTLLGENLKHLPIGLIGRENLLKHYLFIKLYFDVSVKALPGVLFWG